MKKIFNLIWKHPRGRVLLFIVGFIVVFIIVSNMFFKKTVTPNLPSKTSNVKINPQDNVAVSAADDQYQALADKHKKATLQDAEKSGKSYMASIFSFSDDQNKSDEKDKNASNPNDDVKNQSMDPKSFYEQKSGQSTSSSSQTYRSTDTNNNTSEENYSGYVNPKLETAYQKQMSQSLKDLVSAWGTGFNAQTVEGDNNDAGGAGKGALKGQGPLMIKAGDVLFAVVDTAVNSDQEGTPVMATIVTGKYKDAKLLGSFKRVSDRLVIQFSTMSVPSMNNSIGISAYAINSKTAQTALASDVDNHYLTRWGGLFASAFLQGFGTYFTNQSTSGGCPSGTYFCINTGDANSNNPNNYTVTNGVYSGIGQIGTALADSMGQEFNRQPTVTLNQGTGIGILFMSDVHVGDKASPTIAGVGSDNNSNQGNAQQEQNQQSYNNSGYPPRAGYMPYGYPQRGAMPQQNYNY